MYITNPTAVSVLELERLVPELAKLKKTVEHNAWHENDDVHTHVMQVLRRLRDNLLFSFIPDDRRLSQLHAHVNTKIGELTRKEILLWSALFHDLAKPETLKNTRGITSCPGHEKEGAKMTLKIFTQMGAQEKDKQMIVRIVACHSVPIHLFSPDKSAMLRARDIKEAKRQYQDIFTELLLLGLSDIEGCQLSSLDPKEYRFRIEQYHTALLH